jgi:hypothetical protein
MPRIRVMWGWRLEGRICLEATALIRREEFGREVGMTFIKLVKALLSLIEEYPIRPIRVGSLEVASRASSSSRCVSVPASKVLPF